MKKCYTLPAIALLLGMATAYAGPATALSALSELNRTNCDQASDVEPPTITCLNGISVNIMPSGMITLWTTDFLLYTEDNVTPTAQIRLAIRKAGTGTGFPVDGNGQPIEQVTFNCSELGTDTIELWAIDLAGNATFCTTYLILQDIAGACGGNLSPQGVCSKTWCEHTWVEDASLVISGTSPFLPPIYFSSGNNSGCWDLPNIPLPPSYKITLEKDDNPLNGVSSYDLVLLSQHIHGIKPFTEPWQWIAADANRDNVIDLQDSIEFSKLVLGIYTVLPNNTSWRFVRADYVFPQPNPLSQPFPESITVAELNDSYPTLFYGVKIGDLSCPYSLAFGPFCTRKFCDNEPLQDATIFVKQDSVIFAPPLFLTTSQNGCVYGPNNFPVVYPITVTPSLDIDPLNGVNTYDLILMSNHIRGTQPFTEPWQWIAADVNRDNLVNIQDSIELSKLIHGVFTDFPNNTSYRFVPSNYTFQGSNPLLESFPESVTVSGPLDSTGVSFRAIKIGDLSCGMASSVHNADLNRASVSLSPNPTNAGTTMTLELPKPEPVQLQIRDISGKLLFNATIQAPAGRQTLEIPAEALPGSGVYLWNVLIGQKMESGKIVHI